MGNFLITIFRPLAHFFLRLANRFIRFPRRVRISGHRMQNTFEGDVIYVSQAIAVFDLPRPIRIYGSRYDTLSSELLASTNEGPDLCSDNKISMVSLQLPKPNSDETKRRQDALSNTITIPRS